MLPSPRTPQFLKKKLGKVLGRRRGRKKSDDQQEEEVDDHHDGPRLPMSPGLASPSSGGTSRQEADGTAISSSKRSVTSRSTLDDSRLSPAAMSPSSPAAAVSKEAKRRGQKKMARGRLKRSGSGAVEDKKQSRPAMQKRLDSWSRLTQASEEYFDDTFSRREEDDDEEKEEDIKLSEAQDQLAELKDLGSKTAAATATSKRGKDRPSVQRKDSWYHLGAGEM